MSEVAYFIGGAAIGVAVVLIRAAYRTLKRTLTEYDYYEESLRLWEEHCPDKDNCPDVLTCAEEIRWELGYRGYI